jgi:hypothetical protein
MAWPLKQCAREKSHAPHTWQKSGLTGSGWNFCSGMEAKTEGGEVLTGKECDRVDVHSSHHWERRGFASEFPLSHWCAGVGHKVTFGSGGGGGFVGVGYDATVGGGAVFGRGGGEASLLMQRVQPAITEVSHCSDYSPHKPHEHSGPVASDVEARVFYWCEGQPEYENPPLAESTLHIVTKLLPEMAEKVLRDAKHYGGENHRDLGQRGQFVEINGKIGPLKRVLWEGHETVREDVREIATDLIGHCLLLIEMIDHGVSLDGS